MALTNAHLEPGHIATLRAVARDFEAHAGQPLAFADKTRRANAQRLTAEFQSGSCHAGQYETSLVLAIRPELVRMDLAAALPEHVVPLHERIAAGAKDFVECGVPRAYCGNPAGASAARTAAERAAGRSAQHRRATRKASGSVRSTADRPISRPPSLLSDT